MPYLYNSVPIPRRHRAVPCMTVGFTGLSYSIFFSLYLHETEHAIIDKMAPDPTDHEIGPRRRKKHDFNTVLAKRSTEV
jgi:hypothetical protein